MTSGKISLLDFLASADNSAMDANDTLRKEISDGLAKTGLDATALSKRIGRSKDFVRDFLIGRKRGLAADAAEQIRRVLIDAGSPANAVPGPLHYRPPPQVVSESNRIPLFASAEGGGGSMIVSTEEIDRVPRPYTLEHVREAYAILIEGDSMDPAFEPGDIAWVNPLLGARRNHDVIIFGSDRPDGEARAMIKRMVSSTDDEWTVKQYNPAKQFVLLRSNWGVCHRVVGKLSKR